MSEFKVVQSTTLTRTHKRNFQINQSIVEMLQYFCPIVGLPFRICGIAATVFIQFGIRFRFSGALNRTEPNLTEQNTHVLAINLAFKTKIFWKLLQHLHCQYFVVYEFCLYVYVARAF